MPPVNDDQRQQEDEILAPDSEGEEGGLADYLADVEAAWNSFVTKSVRRIQDPAYENAFLYDHNAHFRLTQTPEGSWTLIVMRRTFGQDRARPLVIDTWEAGVMHFGIIQYLIGQYNLFHFEQGDRVDEGRDFEPFFDFEYEYPPEFDMHVPGIQFLGELHLVNQDA